MPRVRIFLLTHRRPQLLRRALGSLLAQTFTDWSCELHNDAPDDDAPLQILAELAPRDSRFTYVAHKKNWGALATFNHAFAGGAEPFASLLEDDNWWEPSFLATALLALEANATAALVWANLRIWQEQRDGRWLDTGTTVWTCAPSTPATVEFCPPELLQAMDALHSNGAMVFRPEKFSTTSVPPSAPFAIIEQLRERTTLGPLLFLTEPLANFARTLSTAREGAPDLWLQSKLLIATSFFQAHTVPNEALRSLWQARRKQSPPDTGIFFCLAIAMRRPGLVRYATVRDWLRFCLSAARHPLVLARGLRFRRDQLTVWRWLDARTAAARGQVVHATVFLKHVDLTNNGRGIPS